jgi:serine/threonine protein kinase/type IV secretory pathway VirB3-like protein
MVPETWSAGHILLNRYKLEKIIGQGGFAQVWRATDVVLSRFVAVKALHPSMAPGNQRRFVREAQILAKLGHPSVVTIHDVVIDSNRPFIVMEFVNGSPLSVLIRQGQISTGQALRVAIQIADGLAYLHSQSIVHRDVKPSNILVITELWVSKLSDFGIALIIQDDLGDRTLSGPGPFAGTLPYIAPEFISKTQERGTALSDIYSFGATLFQLFTGQLPFKESDINALLSRTKEAPPNPKEINLALPDELSELIQCMMSTDPSKRVKSASAIAEVLSAITSDFQMPSRSPRAAVPEGIIGSFATQEHLLNQAYVPSGFFSHANISRAIFDSKFFQNDGERCKKIQQSVQCYRDHLQEEYESLIDQARATYRLWVGCVFTGVTILFAGVVAMLMGYVAEGTATSALTIIMYFIQKIFQQREDHYRACAVAKSDHLEYGNHWLFVTQSIDAINNTAERGKHQATLANILMQKLGNKQPSLPINPAIEHNVYAA